MLCIFIENLGFLFVVEEFFQKTFTFIFAGHKRKSLICNIWLIVFGGSESRSLSSFRFLKNLWWSWSNRCLLSNMILISFIKSLVLVLLNKVVLVPRWNNWTISHIFHLRGLAFWKNEELRWVNEWKIHTEWRN